MSKPDEILDRIIEGGMYLLLWGVAVVAALVVFAFVTGVTAIISGSLVVGAAVGLTVTLGMAFVLYQVGRRVL